MSRSFLACRVSPAHVRLEQVEDGHDAAFLLEASTLARPFGGSSI